MNDAADVVEIIMVTHRSAAAVDGYDPDLRCDDGWPIGARTASSSIEVSFEF